MKAFLGFSLDAQAYALPLEQLLEVSAMVSITPLSNVQPPVFGYIRYRGDLVPVASLRQRLGLPEVRPALDHHLLLVTVGDRTAALPVDRVDGLRQFSEEQVQPLEPSAAPVSHMLEGPEGIVLIMNLAEVMSLEQLRSATDAIGELRAEGVES